MAAEPYAAGQRWLRDHWPEVVESWPRQWVIAHGDGLVASSESLDDVLAQARAYGDWNELAFAFVDGQELEPGGGMTRALAWER